MTIAKRRKGNRKLPAQLSLFAEVGRVVVRAKKRRGKTLEELLDTPCDKLTDRQLAELDAIRDRRASEVRAMWSEIEYERRRLMSCQIDSENDRYDNRHNRLVDDGTGHLIEPVSLREVDAGGLDAEFERES